MNSIQEPGRKFLKSIALYGMLGFAAACHADTFTIDGIRNNEPAYTARAVQANSGNQGNGNILANLHTAVSDANLLVSIGGRANDNNAILLFIDSKPGGVSFIPNNLITSGGEEFAINNLGQSPTVGMRFETDFQPDYAIRISGLVDDAPVSRYNLQTGTRHSAGDSGSAIRSSGFISQIRTYWQDVNLAYTDVAHGVEMSLNLPLMGVPAGTSTVKLMAILVNSTSTSAFNQTLGSLNTPPAPPRPDIGTAITTFDFETEPGIQTIQFDVTCSVTDSDGDGLLDANETNDGIYSSPAATGSNPLNPDTDVDSFPDGQEVSGTTSFGFITNPNIPNYAEIWAPGNFTIPQWTGGTASTAMIRLGTDLSGQYLWRRDYRIGGSQLGSVGFKFSAGGSPEIKWGGIADAPGTVSRNSNDIPGKAPATGFYQIDFNQAALTYQFSRKVFPDVAAYLAAYERSPGTDGDGDGILNETEFTANTDPTNADSDNDGKNDLNDPLPLLAVRDITFSVNMNFQVPINAFTPGVDAVKVQFFDGVAAPGELSLSQIGSSGIYTGTLPNIEGAAGLSFGGYKFAIVRPSPAPVVFESAIPNRDFTLGPAHVTQQLPEVFFNNFEGSGSPAYEAWADQFDNYPGSPGQDADGDTFTNHEEFLFGTHPGQRNTSLIQMLHEGDNLIVQWNERDSGDASYDLQQSGDLSENSWAFPPNTNVDQVWEPEGLPPGYAQYKATIPIDDARKFIRIKAVEE